MESVAWTSSRFEAVAATSQVLHGNKHMLPVAAAIIKIGAPTIKAPEISIFLSGRLPANRVLEALQRLCALGVVHELPYPGRPAPRIFEPATSAYWDFVDRFLAEGAQGPIADPGSSSQA